MKNALLIACALPFLFNISSLFSAAETKARGIERIVRKRYNSLTPAQQEELNYKMLMAANDMIMMSVSEKGKKTLNNILKQYGEKYTFPFPDTLEGEVYLSTLLKPLVIPLDENDDEPNQIKNNRPPIQIQQRKIPTSKEELEAIASDDEYSLDPIREEGDEEDESSDEENVTVHIITNSDKNYP